MTLISTKFVDMGRWPRAALNDARVKRMATQTANFPATTTAPASAGVLLPAFTLWWREIVRFYRQRARVVGVILAGLAMIGQFAFLNAHPVWATINIAMLALVVYGLFASPRGAPGG